MEQHGGMTGAGLCRVSPCYWGRRKWEQGGAGGGESEGTLRDQLLPRERRREARGGVPGSFRARSWGGVSEQERRA